MLLKNNLPLSWVRCATKLVTFWCDETDKAKDLNIMREPIMASEVCTGD